MTSYTLVKFSKVMIGWVILVFMRQNRGCGLIAGVILKVENRQVLL